MRKDNNKKEIIAELLINVLKKKKINIKKQEIIDEIEIPPSQELGDYSFPCFFLASKFKENPSEIAVEIREDMKTSKLFSDIQTKGPYINFFLDKRKLAVKILSDILSEKDNFGKSEIGKGKTIMIEFSQPNTHKAFHIGHVRGTCIGESLSRILEFYGNKVIRTNYQGDSGMHVAKWIWCYKKHHFREKLKEDESWIASIYVDAVKRLKKNEELQTEVNEINRKLESGEDKELNKLWEKTREISLKSFERIYSQLNTHFERYYFEKDMEKRGREIVESLLNNKIAKKSQGAIIIDLEKYNLGIWVLIRTDTTVLYSTKELALVEKKFKDFPLDESISVMGAAQSLYFSQFIKTLELSKFKEVDKSKAIFFSEVRFPTGKMSSRTGENILYSDFLTKIVSYSKREIEKRDSKIKKTELEKRALKVSIAAIKYSMLKQNEQKNIIFEIKESLNFEGNSGPYILYSYARANSILKKSEKKGRLDINNLDDKEIELIKKMSDFHDVVSRSYTTLTPSHIANYSYQLAKVFNEFYHSCPVIKSKKEDFRILLVKSFMQVLENSLHLLGIDTLKEM